MGVSHRIRVRAGNVKCPTQEATSRGGEATAKSFFTLTQREKIEAVPVKEGANFNSGAPVALVKATAREPVALNWWRMT